MVKPIYSSIEHQVHLEEYLTLMLSIVKEISSDTKYLNFLEVVDLIIDYHNGYGKDVEVGNWNDWLMILPLNLSVCCNGYFAALETKRNMKSIRTYKVLLDKYLEDCVTNLSNLEYKNE
jgi:hypothetical protein|tara:strand:- start:918 stop:1274 length:357 start_codon:yes stop_codon:yes gene_type:complete